jgi:2,5-furandicarboxylate decarboxylase 1
MAVTSFRELLAYLETNGLLRHIRKSVQPAHELMTVVRKVQLGPNLALQFDAVNGTAMPVASNIMSRREAIAASLGVKVPDVLNTLAMRQRTTGHLKQVDASPVQEIVMTGQAVDVARDIPQVVHSEHDGGAYISAGIFIARHPATGIYNASWNRVQIVRDQHLRVRMMAPQHLGQYHLLAEQRGEALPAVCVIGAPPALMLSASSKAPLEADELLDAAALQGQPLRVVAAKTVPLAVPADAEIAIEGEIVPLVREDEGPFGEFMDAYVPVDKNHVFKVTAITRRHDAIYHAILAGTPEDLNLLATMLQVEVFRAVSAFAEVRDIGSPGQIMGCVVSIVRKPETDLRAAMAAALNAHRWMKCVVFVDCDVNPHSSDDVMWALHTRFRPDSGILHLSEQRGFSRVRDIHVGKVALDATYPPHLEPDFRRRQFPKLPHIDLADYLDGTN